jgi:hypothetical protein
MLRIAIIPILLATLELAAEAPAHASPLVVTLAPAAANPRSPQMGDRIAFHSVVRNASATDVTGLIAWISLLEVDPGQEQPVDLEDWSAKKAVTVPRLGPGMTVETDWPVRLIQSGQYRLVVSVVSHEAEGLTASPLSEFSVRRKPVVESRRVLVVAFGIPLGIVVLMALRRGRMHRPRATPPTVA